MWFTNLDFLSGGSYHFILMGTPPANGTKAELDYRLSFKKIDAVVTIARAAIKYGALVACAGFLYRSIAVLSGKATLATIGLNILGNLTIQESISIVLTVGSIIYGVGQRQMRRKNIARLTERTIELEKRLDPRRTSSGLTNRGTTRPEDKTC